MIRGAPSKNQEDVVLFFPKERRSVVGLLTIFNQHYFFTMRRMVIYKWKRGDRADAE